MMFEKPALVTATKRFIVFFKYATVGFVILAVFQLAVAVYWFKLGNDMAHINDISTTTALREWLGNIELERSYPGHLVFISACFDRLLRFAVNAVYCGLISYFALVMKKHNTNVLAQLKDAGA